LEHVLALKRFSRGSIRKAGNRVRIIVQLVDAENGYHLWSERFDREIEDIFAIQDEIAHSVLDALGLSLAEREERRFLKLSTTNVEAYEFYLRGRKLFQTWNRQNMEFARQMFARAVAIDPEFALAWAGLAITYVDLYRWGRNSRDLEEAQRTSAHALKLDPNLAEAHVAIGQALAMQRQFKDAATEFERLSNWIPLPTTHIIFMRDLHSKLETSTRRWECLKRRTDRDRKIIRLLRCALWRCTSYTVWMKRAKPISRSWP
jgi:tetratricopeptide (TPR) repeat protein